MGSKYLILHRRGWPTRARLLRIINHAYEALDYLEDMKHDNFCNHRGIELSNRMRAMVHHIESVDVYVKDTRKRLHQMKLPL